MASDWKRFEELSIAQFSDELGEVASEMQELLYDKRQSYGPSNLTKFGDIGVLVRTSDKFERLAHMHRQGITTTAVGEDDEDAWRDICGYALLVLLARRLGRKPEPEPVANYEPVRVGP